MRCVSSGSSCLATNDTLDAQFHAARVQWEFMPGFCIANVASYVITTSEAGWD